MVFSQLFAKTSSMFEPTQNPTTSAQPVVPGTSLLALMGAIESSDTEIVQKPLSHEVQFNPEGINDEGEHYALDAATRSRLWDACGAPVRYWQNHTPAFQAMGFAAHAARGDFGAAPVLVIRNRELVTIARGELLSLPNSDVIRAVQDALGNDSESLSVAQIGGDPDCLDVELVSASQAISVRTGDIVQSGLHIMHRRFSDEATLVEAFVYRLVCSNGMTRRECSGLRTRKLPIDFPNNRALQINQIRRLTQETWKGLRVQREALRATSERRVHVEELLTRWIHRARISPRLMARVLAAWQAEGSEETHYGAVNALTRVATHDLSLSLRQRRVLASLAGLLAFSEVHICPRCFSVLGRGAGEASLAA
jgi:hypothetical protein